MSSMNVKRGDTVEVIVGDEKEKGKRGKILVANPEKNKVIVENLNLVKKHSKPRSAQEKGGIVEKPREIDASNVMVVCPKCGKATRVGHILATDGKKYVRACKKCGANIDAKAEKATKKTAKKKAVKEVKAEVNKEE